MFTVKKSEGSVELIFQDQLGRDCCVAGLTAGSEPAGLMFGLHDLRLLCEVNGDLKVAETHKIGIAGAPDNDDITILRGAPMALGRDMVAALIPILQHYVNHGTMPPVITIAAPDEPETGH